MVFGVVLLPIMLISGRRQSGRFGPESHRQPRSSLVSRRLDTRGVAIYRAQRYRLPRTTWRGIRGGLDGDGWDYAWTYFWTTILIPLTLGWIMPWRTVKLQSLVSNRMRFGHAHFSFAASPIYLYKRYSLVWFTTALLSVTFMTLYGMYYYSMYGMPGPTADASAQSFPAGTSRSSWPWPPSPI